MYVMLYTRCVKARCANGDIKQEADLPCVLAPNLTCFSGLFRDKVTTALQIPDHPFNRNTCGKTIFQPLFGYFLYKGFQVTRSSKTTIRSRFMRRLLYCTLQQRQQQAACLP